MIQLILHLIGDYITQSDWMAQGKTQWWFPALVHATVYSSLFFLIGDWRAVLVIWATHYLIDRYRLARYVVWAKNWLGPMNRMETFVEAAKRWKSMGILPQAATKADLDRVEADRRLITSNLPWRECSATGYAPSRPEWLTFWLLIIADNTIHLAINYGALRWL